jgi:TolA-binding protein
MNSQDKMNDLQSQINQLKISIKNCKHDWSEAKYDGEIEKVQDDRMGYEGHGADRWPVYSFHDEEKARWSRKCKICGHKEYTYKQETVIIKSETKPKFK